MAPAYPAPKGADFANVLSDKKPKRTKLLKKQSLK
jgi:hypothetical protein